MPWMHWTALAAEYLVGPGVIFVMFSAAVLAWLLLRFGENHAILPFFNKNVSLVT